MSNEFFLIQPRHICTCKPLVLTGVFVVVRAVAHKHTRARECDLRVYNFAMKFSSNAITDFSIDHNVTAVGGEQRRQRVARRRHRRRANDMWPQSRMQVLRCDAVQQKSHHSKQQQSNTNNAGQRCSPRNHLQKKFNSFSLFTLKESLTREQERQRQRQPTQRHWPTP